MRGRILCRLIRTNGSREDTVGRIEEGPESLAVFRFHSMVRRLGRSPGYHRLTLQLLRQGGWRNEELVRAKKGGGALQYVRKGRALETPRPYRPA